MNTIRKWVSVVISPGTKVCGIHCDEVQCHGFEATNSCGRIEDPLATAQEWVLTTSFVSSTSSARPRETRRSCERASGRGFEVSFGCRFYTDEWIRRGLLRWDVPWISHVVAVHGITNDGSMQSYSSEAGYLAEVRKCSLKARHAAAAGPRR